MTEVAPTQSQLAAHQMRLIELGLFPPSKCREKTKDYVRQHSAEFNIPADTPDEFRCVKLASQFGPFSIMKGGHWIARRQEEAAAATAVTAAAKTVAPLPQTRKPSATQQKEKERKQQPTKRSAENVPSVPMTKKTKRMMTVKVTS